jgi:hypothetical protein
MMAALARVVHDCQSAADPEHNCHQGNQQGGLHHDLPNVAPELTSLPNYWGSNEPTVNSRAGLGRVIAPPIVIESYFNCVETLLNVESSVGPVLYRSQSWPPTMMLYSIAVAAVSSSNKALSCVRSPRR